MVSRGVDLLEFSEDALQLLWRSLTTNIADDNLDCGVSFSAGSIRFVEYVLSLTDPRAVYLTSFEVRIETAVLAFLGSPMTYAGGVSRVHVELQLAPDRFQPRRSIARPSAFVSFVRTDRHKSPHEGCYGNRTVRGMPFPCQPPVKS